MPNYSADKDMKLWKEYKQAKDSGNHFLAQQKARELYQEMKGVIFKETTKYRNYGIPMVAVNSEGRKKFKEAIDRFDPKYGTKLSTFVTEYVKGVRNFTKKYKDVARIPQHRQLEIHNYSKTKADLEVKLGREPNAQEMAEELKWNINEVSRMERELRKEFSSSQLMEKGIDIDFSKDSRNKDTLYMVYLTLDGEEKKVMEYLTGFGGKPKLDSGKEIAIAIGSSPATVSRIRGRIAEKIKQYL